MAEQLAAAQERRARERSAREKADVEKAVRESLKSEQERKDRQMAERLAEVERKAAAAAAEPRSSSTRILFVDREPDYDYYVPTRRVTSIEDLFGSPTVSTSMLRARVPRRNISRERVVRLIDLVSSIRQFLEKTIRALSGEKPACPSFSYEEIMARPSELYDTTVRSVESVFRRWGHLSKKEFLKKKRTLWDSSEEDRDEMLRAFRKVCRLQASIREHWSSGLSALESAAVPDLEARMRDFSEVLSSVKFRRLLIDDD
jgi:hypothetical protein